jgi:hypothetical protein
MSRLAEGRLAQERESLTLDDMLEMQSQFLGFAAGFGILVMTQSGNLGMENGHEADLLRRFPPGRL